MGKPFDLSIETGTRLPEEASAATGKRNAVPTQPERPSNHRLSPKQSFPSTKKIGQSWGCSRTLAVAHMNDIQVDVFINRRIDRPLRVRELFELAMVRLLVRDRTSTHSLLRSLRQRLFNSRSPRMRKKRYCSDRCREAAHNERTAQSKAWARRLFLQKEMSVDAIRKRLFAHEQKTTGSERIKKWLSSWPDLKHALDEDIQPKGWGSPLLARCRKE